MGSGHSGSNRMAAGTFDRTRNPIGRHMLHVVGWQPYLVRWLTFERILISSDPRDSGRERRCSPPKDFHEGAETASHGGMQRRPTTFGFGRMMNKIRKPSQAHPETGA